MANQEHLDLLRQGAKTWNQWRSEHLKIQPDLSGADLSEANLYQADLNHTNLTGANLSGANLSETTSRSAQLNLADLSHAYLIRGDFSGANLGGANLSGADLSEAHLTIADLKGADLTEAKLIRTKLNSAHLREANLSKADLTEADLTYAFLIETDLNEANLNKADLTEADLINANLRQADLSEAKLVKTTLKKVILTGCRIYGISAWDVHLEDVTQLDLVITPSDQPIITVDNLEVAQFIYLLLNNQKIRDVIDTITSKVVLILGRFTPERKAVLDALRNKLRQHNYSPVLFDFEKPASKDLTGTVSTLANLARFIIVDLTNPSSAPHEVATIIPHTVVPVQPLLSREPLLINGEIGERREYAMFEDLRLRHHWVLSTFHYQDTAELLASLQEQIIAPAEQKARELMQPK
jgi:uncharacterized protein YjbI with pentapeptide repeats